MSVQPELSVRIVVDLDQQKARSNARSSVVYRVDGDTLVLAQTEPSVNRSMINKEIVVTYLCRENESPVRYGISAIVSDVIDRYELAREQYARVIVIRTSGEPKPYDLRMCYRVGQSRKINLDLSIAGEKINCIDISLSGIRFGYPNSLALVRGAVAVLHLVVGRAVVAIEARIIRTWETAKESSGTGLSFAAAEFLNISGKIKQELSRKIREIERRKGD